MRAENLKKHAHLLTPGELRRRGITRYDAEIILSQGINLPSPKPSSPSCCDTPTSKIGSQAGLSKVPLQLMEKTTMPSKNINRNINKMWRKRRARRRLSCTQQQNALCPDRTCDSVGEGEDANVGHMACTKSGHCSNEKRSDGSTSEVAGSASESQIPLCSQGCNTSHHSSLDQCNTPKPNLWNDMCCSPTASEARSKPVCSGSQVIGDEDSSCNDADLISGSWSQRRSSPLIMMQRKQMPEISPSGDLIQHSTITNSSECMQRLELSSPDDPSLLSVAIKQEKPDSVSTESVVLGDPATAEGAFSLEKSTSSISMPHLRPQMTRSFSRSESCKAEKKPVASSARHRSSSTSQIIEMPVLTKENFDEDDDNIPLARLIDRLDDKACMPSTCRRYSSGLLRVQDTSDRRRTSLKGSKKSRLRPAKLSIDTDSAISSGESTASPRFCPTLERLLTNGLDVNHNSPVKGQSQSRSSRLDMSPRTKRMDSPFSLTSDSSNSQFNDLIPLKTKDRVHEPGSKRCADRPLENGNRNKILRVPKLTIRLRHIESETSDSSAEKGSPVKATQHNIIYEIMPSPESSPAKSRRKRKSSLSFAGAMDSRQSSTKMARKGNSCLTNPQKLTRVKLKIGSIQMGDREIAPVDLQF